MNAKHTDAAPICDLLKGRIAFLRDAGSVKDRDLMQAALTEIESLQADAERYRWLRATWGRASNRVPHVTQYQAQQFDKQPMPQISDVGLDSAIDAAMKAGATNSIGGQQ